MSKPKARKWFVLGAGGQARMVIATARAAGWPNPEACLIEDGAGPAGEPSLGIPMLLQDSVLDQGGIFFPAIGCNETRRRVMKQFCDSGWQPLTICHPRAVVEKGVKVGPGTVIAMGALIQTGAVLGTGVIINTGAIVEHDVQVGDFSHLAPGSIVLGEASLGQGVLVGAGARILPKISVGDEAQVGAGAVVLKDVAASATVAGVPARRI